MTIILVNGLTTEQQERGLEAVRRHTGITDTDPLWRMVSIEHLYLGDRIFSRYRVPFGGTLSDAARIVASIIAPRRPIRSIVISGHSLIHLEIARIRSSVLAKELYRREPELTYYVIGDEGDVIIVPAGEMLKLSLGDVLKLLIGQPA